MKTMNVTPMTVAQYESVATTKFNKKAFTTKCKKATSKFINNYMAFFQYSTGMYVDPKRQQIWH